MNIEHYEFNITHTHLWHLIFYKAVNIEAFDSKVNDCVPGMCIYWKLDVKKQILISKVVCDFWFL